MPALGPLAGGSSGKREGRDGHGTPLPGALKREWGGRDMLHCKGGQFSGYPGGERNYKYVARANNFNINHVRCYPVNIYKRAAKVAG